MIETQPKIDVLIFIALEEELKVFASVARFSQVPSESSDGLRTYRHRLTTHTGENVECATILIGDQGLENSASAAARVLQHHRPKLVVNVGISGRTDTDYKLCDVVIANEVDHPLYRAKVKNGTLEKAGRSYPLGLLAEPLYQFFEISPPPLQLQTELTVSELNHLQITGYIGEKSQIRLGPIFATTFVIDDEAFTSEIKERNRLLGAADMESAGIVGECWKRHLLDGQLLVVRGLSDPANGRKRELDTIRGGVIRRIAMRNATTVTIEAIKTLNFQGEASPTLTMTKSSIVDATAQRRVATDLVDILNQLDKILTEENAPSIAVQSIQAIIAKEGLEPQLSEIARQAYQTEVEEGVGSDTLSHLNTTAHDYLVAHHVMSSVLSDPKTADSESSHYKPLSYVYPQRVNKFCKGILALQVDEFNLTNRLLRAAELLASKSSVSTRDRPLKRRGASAKVSRSQQRAHACYLLGRLRTTPQKQKAAEALEVWLNEVFIGREISESDRDDTLVRKLRKLENKEDRMLVRTILISLVLLGKSHKSDDYLKACLRDRKFDELNRGFHLEYYGDLEYHKKESMSHVDDLRYFPNTFRHLHSKIAESFNRGTPYELRDIELQTLLSLCQQRHLKSLLLEEHRLKLLKLLDSIPNSSISQQLQLRSFARMVQKHLAKPFSEANLAVEAYRLKKKPRAGWNANDRLVLSPETVMAHVCGGLDLIQLYLPERLSREDVEAIGSESCRGYSKDKVIRMFLVHDWAEAYTGDLLPHERTEITAREEELVMSEIDNFSTYPNVEMNGTYALWREFQNGSTINARLAREIDKLENLLQLEIEHSDKNNSIPDYIEWRDSLLDEIRTPLGRRIAKMLCSRSTAS